VKLLKTWAMRRWRLIAERPAIRRKELRRSQQHASAAAKDAQHQLQFRTKLTPVKAIHGSKR